MMKNLKYILLTIIAMAFYACIDDDEGLILDKNSVDAPSEVNAIFTISDDNTGTVTVTPSALSTASFEVLFGDATDEEPTLAKIGETLEHAYAEGDYTLTITAVGSTGQKNSVTKSIVVSFDPPTNLDFSIETNELEVVVTPTASDAFSFEVYFGEDPDAEPVQVMPEETATYTYGVDGTYDIRVVAIGAAIATSELTKSVSVEVSQAPLEAAPTPAQAENAVISLFSDAYTDVVVDTWRTDWSDATFEDVNINGDDLKKYSNLGFVGIETVASTIDASGMTHFSFDVWSIDAEGFNIKLVDFGADGAFDGGDDVEHELPFTDLVQGEWNSYDIPLSDFTGLTTTSNIAQYIFVGNPSATATYFIDHVYFYNENGAAILMEPDISAPMPTQPDVNVISLFSDVYTDVTVDTWRTDWSNSGFEDVTIVGDPMKKYIDLGFVGIETVITQVNASNMTHFSFDIFSGNGDGFNIKLVDFGADGAFSGGDDVEHELIFDDLVKGQWNSYNIPLSDFTELTTKANIAQYILVGNPSAGATYFLDNVYFYAEQPEMAAPTPTDPSTNVISLFSDAYTDVTVDTWRTDWSEGATTLEDIMIEGDAVRKYANLGFVGIETTSSQIDASAMTHFRFDLWTADATTIKLKLVDFGADGSFDGGDDVEHEVTIYSPAQNQWTSFDIPLSDFTGLTTKSNIAQYILRGEPYTANTIFLDNVYFRN